MQGYLEKATDNDKVQDMSEDTHKKNVNKHTKVFGMSLLDVYFSHISFILCTTC